MPSGEGHSCTGETSSSDVVCGNAAPVRGIARSHQPRPMRTFWYQRELSEEATMARQLLKTRRYKAGYE